MENHDYELNRLRMKLERDAESGTPSEFEAIVDGLTVIERTDDPGELDSLPEFIIPGMTRHAEVRIYRGQSMRYQKVVLDPGPTGKAAEAPTLQGIEDRLGTMLKEERAKWDTEHRIRTLEGEVERLTRELADTEEYATLLEKEVEDEKANRFKLGGVSMLTVAGEVLGGVVRQNPSLLRAIPGGIGETLAGIVQDGGQEPEPLPPPAPVSIARAVSQPEEMAFVEDALEAFARNADGNTLMNLAELIGRFAESPGLVSRCLTALKPQNPDN